MDMKYLQISLRTNLVAVLNSQQCLHFRLQAMAGWGALTLKFFHVPFLNQLGTWVPLVLFLFQQLEEAAEKQQQ